MKYIYIIIAFLFLFVKVSFSQSCDELTDCKACVSHLSLICSWCEYSTETTISKTCRDPSETGSFHCNQEYQNEYNCPTDFGSSTGTGLTTSSMALVFVWMCIYGYMYYKKKQKSDAKKAQLEAQEEPEVDISNITTIAYIEIIQGFLKGRVVWYQNWKEDLKFYQFNEHPLLACFKGHFLHPIDHKERKMILVCSILFALFVASLTSERATEAECKVFCDNNINQDNCIDNCQSENNSKNNYINIGMGIVTWVLVMILQIAATCSCVQQKYGQDKSAIQGQVEKIGHYFMGIVTILCGLMALLAVGNLGLRDNDLNNFGTNFAINYCVSFFKSFLTGSLLFFWYHKKQTKKIEEELRWHDDYAEYQSLDELEKLYEAQKKLGISEKMKKAHINSDNYFSAIKKELLRRKGDDNQTPQIRDEEKTEPSAVPSNKQLQQQFQQPVAQVPMGHPMGQVPMGQVPMGQVPMGQVPMGQVPMGQVPMGQVPMGVQPVMVDANGQVMQPVMVDANGQVMQPVMVDANGQVMQPGYMQMDDSVSLMTQVGIVMNPDMQQPPRA